MISIKEVKSEAAFLENQIKLLEGMISQIGGCVHGACAEKLKQILASVKVRHTMCMKFIEENKGSKNEAT